MIPQQNSPATRLKPNSPLKSITARFLVALDPNCQTWHFRAFDQQGGARKMTGSLDACWPELARLNSIGYGSFVVINSGGQTREEIDRVRALFVDFDDSGGDHFARLERVPFEPSLIVESSPGKHHAYWLVDDVPVDQFTQAQKALAKLVGSDPNVSDLPRVMRLPGLMHTKGEPVRVELIGGADQRYQWRDFSNFIGQLVEQEGQETRFLGLLQQNEPSQTGTQSEDADARLRDAVSKIAEAPKGTRNQTLYSQALGIFRLVAAGALCEDTAHKRLQDAGRAAALEDGEIATTLQNACKAAQNPHEPQPTPQKRAPALREVPLSDVMSATLEDTSFAVSPWLPRRHVTLFGGHGGVGKSSLALAIGAHVAAGRPFAGYEVTQLPVLFVSLEDEPSIVRLRLRRIIEAYKLPPDDVLSNVRLLDGTRAYAALITEGVGFNAPLTLTPAFMELVETAGGAGLIIIDNASDAFDANENSRRSVRTFLRYLAALARKNDAAVVLLAHIDKSAARDGAKGNNYSGSTAWHNSARSRLALTERDGEISLEHEKSNLSSRANTLRLVFKDGVLRPEGGGGYEGLTSEHFDQAEIIRAMHAAHETGINVPASLTPGAHSAMKALEPLPEYGQTFKGRAGNKRATRALVALLRAGRVKEETYRTPQRKERTRLVACEAQKSDNQGEKDE